MGKTTTQMVPPWGKGVSCCHEADHEDADQATAAFISKRTKLHETFIRETERTRRLRTVVATVLFALACILLVFAPSGHEWLSWGISLALFVFAAGAVGYTTVEMKKDKLRLS
jgi:hypothetical protein